MKRPSLWKRLALSVVAGTAVAVVVRALLGRSAAAPAVPAPSTEWPPLPDLAAGPTGAPAATPVSQEPAAAAPVADSPGLGGPAPSSPTAPRSGAAAAPVVIAPPTAVDAPAPAERPRATSEPPLGTAPDLGAAADDTGPIAGLSDAVRKVQEPTGAERSPEGGPRS